ncbi:MAG: apolipoprotein N-acyltransferase, partial [Elusimicrobiaceae bacterium]
MQYVESAGAQNAPAFSLFRNPLASGFLTAALLVLAYPKFNLSALAWAAFIPFTFGLPALSGYRRAALYGLYTGFVFYAGILYWIVPTCRAGGLNPVLAAGAWLLLALIMACEWAVFSAGVYFFRNAGLLFPLSAALCWTVAEWFKILLAQNAVWFPWFMLGYTQWAQERFIQAASLGGVYLTGFAVVFTGFCAGYAWREKLSFKKTVLVCLPAVVLASAMWGYGYWRLGRISSGGSKISAAALQPNIEQYRKWDAAFEGFICGRLAAQIGTVSVKKPEKLDLVVWPESALPGWLDEARYAALASSAAVRTGAPQLVGAALSSRRQYVSAYLIERYGITGFYDKRELVPFGEYVPLRSVLGKYVGVVNQLGEFVPGRYDSPLMRAGDISVG